MAKLAFYTFGILKEKKGHPLVQGFWDRVDTVFSQAESSEGFLNLDNGSWGKYASPRFFDPEKHVSAPATLSLWKDLESVFAFAYHKTHSEALKMREEWALKPEWPTYAAWWVDDDHFPTREEACHRLEYLHDNGSCPFVFNFKMPFDKDGNPAKLNKELIDIKIKSNDNK
ncbi:MAG TPA: DUF3291 domain-containing protein [Ignavibacteria bacterium]|nr:DUF3291 domain-containing protein [Ignavibacteria bacterium]